MEAMNSQERILAIIEVLAKKGREGTSNKEIIASLRLSAVTVCRDLAVLEKCGWAEATHNGNRRMSPKFGEFANFLARSFQDARLRLTEDEARYRSAMQ